MTQRHSIAAPPRIKQTRARNRLRIRATCWCALILLIINCCNPMASNGQSPEVIDREYPLKAAYLYNFAAYIEWPDAGFDDPKAPLVIGVLGKAPFGEVLDQLTQRKVGNRRVAIRRLSVTDAVDECHILFVAASVSGDQRQRVLTNTRNRPILRVGEVPSFIEDGGDIGFFVQRNKLRFKISIHAVRQQKLNISSKLLRVAAIVDTEHERRTDTPGHTP